MRHNYLGIALVFVSALSSAQLALLAIYNRRSGLSVQVILSWRFALAVLLLMLTKFIVKAPLQISKRDRLTAFLTGASGFALSSICFFQALNYVATGVAAMLLYTFPAMVIIIEWALNHSRPSRQQISAVILSMIGCSMMAGLSTSSNADALIGVALGLGAAFCYAAYLMINRMIMHRASPVDVSLYAMLGAFATNGCLAVFSASSLVPSSVESFALLFAIALIATAIPVLTMLYGVRMIGTVQASIVATIEPVCTMIIGALFLGEILQLGQIGGSIAILAGVGLSMMGSQTQSAPS